MKVWVDCTAAAHPLVLRPIIERLEAQGHEVFITAREYGQTLGILDRLGMPYTAVGEHGGASRLGKALGARAAARRGWPGSSGDRRRSWRSATARSTSPSSPTSSAIPSVQMQDYEFAQLQRQIAFRAARRVLAPESIPVERLKQDRRQARSKLVRYPGLKEEYYLADFEPDPAVLGELGLDREKVLVVVRPPPETSEYHAPNDLYGATIRRLAGADGGAGGDHPPHRGAGRGGARAAAPPT